MHVPPRRCETLAFPPYGVSILIYSSYIETISPVSFASRQSSLSCVVECSTAFNLLERQLLNHHHLGCRYYVAPAPYTSSAICVRHPCLPCPSDVHNMCYTHSTSCGMSTTVLSAELLHLRRITLMLCENSLAYRHSHFVPTVHAQTPASHASPVPL